jgi:hypothetical protein
MKRLSIGLTVFWLASLLAVHAQDQDAPPTNSIIIAIIDRLANPTFSDLLFADLASLKNVALVDRSQVEIQIKELGLEAWAGASSVTLGRQVHAQALLILDSQDVVHRIRLVETARGQCLFDLIVTNNNFQIARTETIASLERARSRLLLSEKDRIYVALMPLVMDAHASPSARDLFVSLSTLLEVHIGMKDRIILLERKNLADVVNEEDLPEQTGTELSAADYVIRMKAETQGLAHYAVDFKIKDIRTAREMMAHVAVDPNEIRSPVSNMVAQIDGFVGLNATSPANATDLEREALYFQVNGLNFLSRKLYISAIQSFEVAHLLVPQNETLAQEFASTVFQYIEEGRRHDTTLNPWKTDDKFTFIRNLQWVRRAMNTQRRLPLSAIPSQTHGSLTDAKFFGYFSAIPADLTDEDKVTVSHFRTELRQFMEWYGNYERVPGRYYNAELFARFSPVFFDDPGESLDYLKSILARDGTRWNVLYSSLYPGITYWDHQRAWTLWTRFLEDVYQDGTPEKQFAVILFNCFHSGAFPDQASTVPLDSPARVAASNLFAWLEQDPKNLNGAASNGNWFIFLRLWTALELIDLKDQDRHFERTMPAILQADPTYTGMSRATVYLRNRYLFNVTLAHAPQDEVMIRKHLNQFLADLGQHNPTLQQQILRELSAQGWSKQLGNSAPIGIPSAPEIPGASLVYDSLDHTSGIGNFDGFNGWLDDLLLWVGWTGNKCIQVARIDLVSGQSVTYMLDTPGKSGTDMNEGMRIVRLGDRLCVADAYQVLIVPISDKPPYLDPGQIVRLGPQIGSSVLGFDPTVAVGEVRRQVTALVAGKEDLYIALGQLHADGRERNLYGAIYRWRPGLTECELICASDSFATGPLNDCLPYHVTAGCMSSTGDQIFFFLNSMPYQPKTYSEGQRHGLWEFTPATRQWRQVQALSFNYTTRLSTPPTRLAANRFVFSGWSWGGTAPPIAYTFDPSQVALQIQPETNGLITSMFEGLTPDLNKKKVIPSSKGRLLLVAGRYPGDPPPTNRCLVYLYPDQSEKAEANRPK